MRNRTKVALAGAALLATGAIASAPANAFTTSTSLTAGGVTYSSKAYSCNLYWSSCSWNAEGKLSASRSFTHRADVKANGISVKITISADPSATISGNSTSLATAKETGYGKSNYVAGVAKPSVFSVSVAARSRLTSGSYTATTGWTTW